MSFQVAVLCRSPVAVIPALSLTPRTLISQAAGSIREHFPALTVSEALESDGAPADVLIRAARQASLLVIGCWGRGGLRKPIGSIAEKVLMQLPCPTIITRPAS